MALGTFSMPRSKPVSKVVRTLDAIDVAAKYFVYNLYDAMRRDRIAWVPLKGIGESQATVERAVELGWALRRRAETTARQSEAALAEEGRRLARMGR